MNERLEDVRRDIENTRMALGDKIGRLEHKIEVTTNTTLNPAYYVRTRPWPTLGVFAFAGWLVGRALRPKRVATNHGVGPSGSLSAEVMRSIFSGAAGAISIVAGDWLRDFIKDRRTRHSP